MPEISTPEISSPEPSAEVAMPRIRKNNLNSNAAGGNEYVYVSAVTRVANARPKPFVSAAAATTGAVSAPTGKSQVDNGEVDRPPESNYSRQYSKEALSNSPSVTEETTSRNGSSDNFADITANGDVDHSTGYSSSTTELMNACKSGLRRLTYRKTYSRSRSGTTEPPDSPDSNNNNNIGSKNTNYGRLEIEPDMSPSSCGSSSITYTQHSSGSRLPNRPTTPGPYLGLDHHTSTALYKRPTTPGPFSRQSWKRTNQKFNYAKFLNYSNHETYV
jgi:hypothetical protein